MTLVAHRGDGARGKPGFPAPQASGPTTKGRAASPAGIGGDATLYVKSPCGFSRAALLARSNLHLDKAVSVRNVSQDPDALSELKQRADTEQAPCLLIGGEPMLESDEIIRRLVAAAAPL